MEDIVDSYVAGMDAYALGLLCAVKLREDGRLDNFVSDRYASWNGELGRNIRAGRETLESLADYAERKGEVTDAVGSSRQEYLENVINSVMFD